MGGRTAAAAGPRMWHFLLKGGGQVTRTTLGRDPESGLAPLAALPIPIKALNAAL